MASGGSASNDSFGYNKSITQLSPKATPERFNPQQFDTPNASGAYDPRSHNNYHRQGTDQMCSEDSNLGSISVVTGAGAYDNFDVA